MGFGFCLSDSTHFRTFGQQAQTKLLGLREVRCWAGAHGTRRISPPLASASILYPGRCLASQPIHLGSEEVEGPRTWGAVSVAGNNNRRNRTPRHFGWHQQIFVPLCHYMPGGQCCKQLGDRAFAKAGPRGRTHLTHTETKATAKLALSARRRQVTDTLLFLTF